MPKLLTGNYLSLGRRISLVLSTINISLFYFAIKNSREVTLYKDLAQECLIKLWQDTFMHINAGEPAILYTDEIVIKKKSYLRKNDSGHLL